MPLRAKRFGGGRLVEPEVHRPAVCENHRLQIIETRIVGRRTEADVLRAIRQRKLRPRNEQLTLPFGQLRARGGVHDRRIIIVAFVSPHGDAVEISRPQIVNSLHRKTYRSLLLFTAALISALNARSFTFSP